MKRSALALLLTACATAGPREFKIRYERENDPAIDAPRCAGFSKVELHDARPEKKIIGERAHEDGKEPAAPITLTNDAPGWVKDGLESQLRYAQFRLGEPNHPVLDVSLNTLDLQEKVFQNGSYNARVVLDVTVVSVNGQRCVNTSIEGSAKNYGSPGEAKNYVQTLNRALDAAAAQLLSNAAVRDAACQCMPGS
jgi:hypothetical protein